jgi:hypothetical protein
MKVAEEQVLNFISIVLKNKRKDSMFKSQWGCQLCEVNKKVKANLKRNGLILKELLPAKYVWKELIISYFYVFAKHFDFFL